MELRTVDVYGAPSYGVRPPRADGRPSTEGIGFHTPENTDISLQSAIAIAQWQAGPENTSGGSYHGILGLAPDGGWVMVRSVPWNLSAGGLTTIREPHIWQPDAWLQGALSAEAFRDPNAHNIQIALSGTTDTYIEHGYPDDALQTLAEWVRVLERAYDFDAVLWEHTFWQADRRDVGENLAQAVLDAYLGEAPAPEPTNVVRVGGADQYETAAALSALNFTAEGAIRQLPARACFVATGENFPDALAAAAAAALHGVPLLLVTRDAIPGPTAAALEQLRPSVIYVIGGPPAVSDELLAQLSAFTGGYLARTGDEAARLGPPVVQPALRISQPAVGPDDPQETPPEASVRALEPPLDTVQGLIRSGSPLDPPSRRR